MPPPLIQLLEENPIFQSPRGYDGCVAGANGSIYGIPFQASHVVEYNPATNTTRLVGDNLGDKGGKWSNGVLGSDGCIYACPSSATRILKYDPTSETTTFVGHPIADTRKFMSHYKTAVAIPDTDLIYFIPYDARAIMQYNVMDGTSSLIGNLGSFHAKWNAACLSKVDGCIYCIPEDHPRVMRFDPADGTITFPRPSFDWLKTRWVGCIEASDGSIYCPLDEKSSSKHLKIDVNKGKIIHEGKCNQKLYSGWQGWGGCVTSEICNELYVWMVPEQSDRVVIFHMNNESSFDVGPVITGIYRQPTISSYDGCMYAMPYDDSKSILKVDIEGLESINRVIQDFDLSWTSLKPIAKGNVNALTEADAESGLVSFMLAAERCSDDHDEDILGSLTIVYELLSMKPEVLKHYIHV